MLLMEYKRLRVGLNDLRVSVPRNLGISSLSDITLVDLKCGAISTFE